MSVPSDPPVVYILHGEDEYAISAFLSELEARLGDPANAVLNIDRLDGRSTTIEKLISVAGAMPFLARRRLVILTNASAMGSDLAGREKFLKQISRLNPTTALVLVEYGPLLEERSRKDGKTHWLEQWAVQAGECAFIRYFPLPKGQALVQRIQQQARQAGGEITPRAAALLATLVNGDPRLSDQEVNKLLAYVNYRRPVDFDDVVQLTADSAQGDIFTMVDALAVRDARQSLGMLKRLLERDDPSRIFGMVVRQFRLLLLARDLLDSGGKDQDLPKALGIHPYVAGKMAVQARRFTLDELEGVFHRLLDLDEAIKTGQVPADLALETLTAAFSAN